MEIFLLWLHDIYLWIRSRLSLLIPITLFVLMTCIPLMIYWKYVYEGLLLYKFWPFIAILCPVFFLFAGLIHYLKSDGRLLHTPIFIFLVSSILLLLCLILLTHWAIDWPWIWCLFSLLILMIVIFITILSFIIHTEIWRLFPSFNSSVVDTVKNALNNGEFIEYTKALLEKKEISKIFGRWCSPHCLRIVQGHYAIKKQFLLQKIGDKTNKNTLDNYFKAGDSLIKYLSFCWPKNLKYEKKGYLINGNETDRLNLTGEILREIITLALWFRSQDIEKDKDRERNDKERENIVELIREFKTVTQPQQADVAKSGLVKKTLIIIENLLIKFIPGKKNKQPIGLKELKEGEQNYKEFLIYLFNLSLENGGKNHPKEIINNTLYLFNRVPNNYKDICACTWISLAPNIITIQDCFDVWMKMCAIQNRGIFIEPDISPYCDPANICGRRKLFENYKYLPNLFPVEWRKALAHRKNYIKELTVKPIFQNLSPEILRDTKDLSSWPYIYIFKSPKVRKFLFCSVSLIIFVFFLALVAANPRFCKRFRNTIDHIEDHPSVSFSNINPLMTISKSAHAETKHSFSTAMATTENWVGMGTEGEFKLINKNSRLHRDNFSQMRVLDVTKGFTPDTFLVLNDDQSIMHIHLDKWLPLGDFWGITSNTWLPKPNNPFWHLSSCNQNNIIANAVDERGWLMAIEGEGISRYQFASLSNGNLYRTRSWQTGPFSNVHLFKAVITEGGVWMVFEDGGINCINYAERSNLEEVTHRKVSTPYILWFDADYKDQWAAAIDVNKSIWLFNERYGRWLGPFFGESTGECRLSALNDVKVARCDDYYAWFGTPYGLFVYDIRKRHISCAVNDINTICIEPLKYNSPAEQIILVAGDRGISIIKNGDQIPLNVSVIDQNPVSSMILSPDFSSAVYIRTNENNPKKQVCILENPQDNVRQEIVIPNEGWKQFGAEPEIIEIKQFNRFQVYATLQNGAFIYYPESHSYNDASISIFKTLSNGNFFEKEVNVNIFKNFQQTGLGIIALGDGNPQIFDNEIKKWRSLDPYKSTNPLQIAEADLKIVGLGTRGELFLYQFPKVWRPVDKYLTGESNALINNPINNGPVIGDLVYEKNEGIWYIAFLYEDHLITYKSENGNIHERPFPVNDKVRVQQIRIQGDNLLYLLDDNGLVIDDSRTSYLGRTPRWAFHTELPFSPSTITAIGQSMERDEVIVAGPSLTPMKYSWDFGLWDEACKSPLPHKEKILEIQGTSEGIFARLEGDTICHTWGKTWTELEGCSKFAIDESVPNFWLLKSDAVYKVIPDHNKEYAKWSFTRFSHESQSMKDFMEKAIFAWEINKHKAAFIYDSKLGVYDSLYDTWEIIDLEDSYNLKNSLKCIASTKYLAILGTNGVLILNSNLAKVSFQYIPPRSKDVCLHLDNEAIKIAYIHEKGIHLRICNDIESNNWDEYSRGENTIPENFDPSRVIYAEQKKTKLFLRDDLGNIVTYDYTNGFWAEESELSSPFEQDEKLKNRFFDWKTLLFNTKSENILETKTIKIVREDLSTNYYIFFNGNWKKMSQDRDRFHDDAFDDVTFSSSGEVWILRDNILVNFIPFKPTKGMLPNLHAINFNGTDIIDVDSILTGHIVVTDSDGKTRTYKETDNKKLVRDEGLIRYPLARLDFAGRLLDFKWSFRNGIKISWLDDENLLVWGKNNRLAIHDIKDITFSETNDLLLKTKIGILVRDQKTYALKAWENKFPIKDKTLKTGPWIWNFSYTNKGIGRLKVFHKNNNKQNRIWLEVKPGLWRFKDDLINWISRDDSYERLWVHTDDGSIYPFNLKNGRTSEDFIINTESIMAEKLEVQDKVIKILYKDGKVSFYPLDNIQKSAFIKGRFYFNYGTQMSVYNKSLYFFIPERGIIKRDINKITNITDIWTLPGNLSKDYKLQSSIKGIQLKAPNNEFVWELNLTDKKGARWQKIIQKAEKDICRLGPIRWQKKKKEDNFVIEPFLIQGNNPAKHIDNWWNDDHFIWDEVKCAGALNLYKTLILTPLGPIALGRNHEIEKVWLLSSINFCESARNTKSDIIGLALGKSGNPPEYIATINQNGEPLIMPINNKETCILFNSFLKIGYKGITTDKYIGIIQAWIPYRLLNNPPIREGVIHSDLSTIVPDSKLLVEGQFIFDRAQGGALVSENIFSNTNQNTWSLFHRYLGQDNEYDTLITFNQIRSETEYPNLVLRDIISIDKEVYSIRASEQNTFFALTRLTNDINSPTNCFKWDIRTKRFKKLNLNNTGESFICGEKVRLNILKSRWDSFPLYKWETCGVLETSPPNYDPFYCNGNDMSLKVDIITSISSNTITNDISLGTYGGVLISQYKKDGRELFKLNQNVSNYKLEALNNNKIWITDIKKVRYNLLGELWINYGDRRKAAQLINTQNWETKNEKWPSRYGIIGEYKINIGSNGFQMSDKIFLMSNDLWKSERRPLSDIVDYAIDINHDVLWICSQKEGLFKIFMKDPLNTTKIKTRDPN